MDAYFVVSMVPFLCLLFMLPLWVFDFVVIMVVLVYVVSHFVVVSVAFVIASFGFIAAPFLYHCHP